MDKQIVVREYGYDPSSVGYPPRALSEVIQILNETLLEIPSEYRASAEVDYSPRWEFGETYDRLRIMYERPETKEEEAARREAELADTSKWIAEQEALIRRRKAEFGLS